MFTCTSSRLRDSLSHEGNSPEQLSNLFYSLMTARRATDLTPARQLFFSFRHAYQTLNSLHTFRCCIQERLDNLGINFDRWIWIYGVLLKGAGMIPQFDLEHGVLVEWQVYVLIGWLCLWGSFGLKAYNGVVFSFVCYGIKICEI